MKKIVALFVALCVSSSLIPITFAADTATLEISDIKLINEKSTAELESNVSNEKQFTSVHPLDPDDGSYMIYMDDTYKSGYTFSPNNFLGNGSGTPNYSAIAWPPTLRAESLRGDLPEQQAEIRKENDTLYSLYSKISKITYKLPERNTSVNGSKKVTGTEAAILDQNAHYSIGMNIRPTTDILVYDRVDKIHFLLASSCNSNKKGAIGVYVNYADGSNTIPSQWTKRASTAFDSYYRYNFKGHADHDNASGENGYLCINLPASLNGQNDAHFVADFENYYCEPTSNAITDDYAGTFVKDSISSTTTISAYEYSIDVDENKTIKDIVFTNDNGSARAGIVVLGMAYEYSEDTGIKGQVESINDSIAYSATLGVPLEVYDEKKVTIEQFIEKIMPSTNEIIDTTEAMLNFKDTPYEEYINFNEETGFGSDNDREITTFNKNSHFNVTFTAKNPTESKAKMYLITALYDENKTLVEAIQDEVEIPACLSKVNISKEVNIPDKDFSYARFYIWNNEIAPYGHRIYNTQDNIFTQVDLTDYATGKFYVDTDKKPPSHSGQGPVELNLVTYNNDMNLSGYTDFAGINGDISSKTAAYYPLQRKDDKTKIIDSSDGLLLSNRTGIKYVMPLKREGVHNKEVVTISDKDIAYDATVYLENDIYKKIHFIISSANEYASKLRAIVNFTDGSREVNCIDICSYEETENEHCLENLHNVSSIDGYGFGHKVDKVDITTHVNLLMLEYSIDVKNPKVVDSISFELMERERTSGLPQNYGFIGNLVLTALTTEREEYSEAETYLRDRANGEYRNEEAEALSEIAEFLTNKGVDCGDLEIPESSDSARQVFISVDADAETADGTIEHPFATVDAACAYIRNEKNASYIGDWEILFRGGTYVVAETIKLNEESLPNIASVTFKPYDNEEVVFTGNTKIDMAEKQSLPATINSRLPSASQGKVVQVNLTKQKITNVAPYELLKYQQKRPPASRIIIDDDAYNVARWPNENIDANKSFAPISASNTTGSDSSNHAYGTHFTINNTSTSNIAKWKNSKDAILQGFFQYYNYRSDAFAFDYNSFNPTTKYVTSSEEDFRVYRDNNNKRFFIENLLEEIDEEGEWYIDHNYNNSGEKVLYIYPLEGEHEYSISTLTDYIFSVSNLNDIHFEDLDFNGGVGGAIYFKNTDNSEIKGCDIRNFTSTAIQIKDCINSGVMSCDMSMLGSGAIVIDETYLDKTYTERNAYIIDCKIENCSTYTRTAGTGAVISLNYTNGARVLNNEISNSTTQAITGSHIKNTSIEYNDISYVQKEFGDAGAIYFGASYISQGNKICNNYIHDMIPYGSVDLHVGIYIDDLGCGFEVNNNVIQNVQMGMLLGGGKNISAENNLIYASGSEALRADQRGTRSDNDMYHAPERRKELIAQLRISPLYRLEFPHTMGDYYLDDSYYRYPANNTIKNNFFYKNRPNIENEWYNATLNNYTSDNTFVSSITTEAFRTAANNNPDVEFNKIGLLTKENR